MDGGAESSSSSSHKDSSNNNNNNNTGSSNSSSQTTLFVANCPVIRTIPTHRLLQAIFGRYGDVLRATVIENPRTQPNAGANQISFESAASSWTSHFAIPSYTFDASTNQQHQQHGKFAHVVMASSKDLKQTMRALAEAMSPVVPSRMDEQDVDDDDNNNLPAISISAIEMQALRRETEHPPTFLMLPSKDNAESEAEQSQPKGILAMVARYRASCRALSTDLLLDECNNVMEEYEHAVHEAQRQRDHDASVPDDDGFVTVSYNTNNSSSVLVANDDDDDDESSAPRAARNKPANSWKEPPRGSGAAGRGGKRTRSKKNMGGADPLPDFYRFQTREHRQNSLHELRRRFEEDVNRVQKDMESRKKRKL